jgi:hypothetical protein
MTSWDQIEATHQHVRQTVHVPMRADLIDEIATLEQRARREAAIDARENRMPVAPQLAEQIRELEDEVAASEVAFVFQAVGRREYAKLLAEHAPSEEQRASAEEQQIRLSYNPDTFPPALLAASCIEPADTTVERMTNVWLNWSEGQVSPLWAACLATNMGSADVGPKSLIASEILRASEPNSTTAAP